MDDIRVTTRSYVDFSFENGRGILILCVKFFDQLNDFSDNNMSKLNSITNIRNPSLDEESTNQKHDDKILNGTIVRFNETLENFSEVIVGKSV